MHPVDIRGREASGQTPARQTGRVAEMPPSTCSVVPCTIRASSEARNSTAGAGLGGGRGIRTLEEREPLAVFKTAAIGH